MAFTFFRKYNKLILAVGGSLLMVVFLVPSAGDWLAGRPTGQPIGRIGERTLTVGDRRRADAEIRFVQALFGPDSWVRGALPGGAEPGMTWLLGLAEARRMGLWASDAQINDRIARSQVTSDQVAAVKSQFNVSDAFVREAIRHALIWQELRRLALESARVSEPRLRHFYQQLNSEAAADFVKIPADHLLDEAPEPTEDELQDRFRISRDDAPGRGPFGFGYRLPPRFKLEYIAVPLEPFRDAASEKVSDIDVRDYYDTHPEQFTPDPEETEEAAEAPDEPRPFTEVSGQIRTLLVNREAREMQQRAVRLIEAALSEAMRGLPREPTTGYYELPADWSPPALSAIAERVQAAEDLNVLPTVKRIEDRWLTLEEVGELGDLGGAVLPPEALPALGQPLPVSLYIAATRELGITRFQQRLRAIAIQEDVASRPVIAADGTRYIFRITEAQPSQPPTSLDQVRAQVVEDVKRLKAYQLLTERADQYVEEAGGAGLNALAVALGGDFEVVSLDLFAQRTFARRALVPPTLEQVGQSASFVDQVFRMARSFDSPDALRLAPRRDRVGQVAIENQLALYIVEVTDHVPAYLEDYAEERAQIAMILRQLDVLSTLQRVSNPFTFDALAQRVGFTRIEPEESDAEEELPPEEAAERPSDLDRETSEAAPAEQATP